MEVPDKASERDKLCDLTDREIGRGASVAVIEHQENPCENEDQKKIEGQAAQTEGKGVPDPFTGDQGRMEMNQKGDDAALTSSAGPENGSVLLESERIAKQP